MSAVSQKAKFGCVGCFSIVLILLLFAVISVDQASRQSPEDLASQELLKDRLKDNFGTPGYETSWYSSIGDIAVKQGTVEVSTSIWGDKKDVAEVSSARFICAAVSNYVFGKVSGISGLKGIRILDHNGDVFVSRYDIADRCE